MGKRMVILFFIAIAIVSCKEEEKCPIPATYNLYVDPYYNNWFDSVSSTVICISSDGISETYNTRRKNEMQHIRFVEDSCYGLIAQDVVLSYSPTYYKHKINLKLNFLRGSEIPELNGETYTWLSNSAVSKFYFMLDEKSVNFSSSYYQHKIELDSSCKKLDNTYVTMLNEDYRDVYRVQFSPPQNSNPNDVTELYISKHYGVIEYKTKSGTVWSFDLK